jgi:hypothetical protein
VLSSNQLTDGGMDSISSLETVKSVDVRQNGDITIGGMKKLVLSHSLSAVYIDRPDLPQDILPSANSLMSDELADLRKANPHLELICIHGLNERLRIENQLPFRTK